MVVVVAAARAFTGHPAIATLALTPDQLGSGHIWLMATSAAIVNGSVIPQLVALASTIVVALRLLGPRFTFAVMIVAHVGATLLAYAALFVLTGDADGAHNRSFDYGTSAVWLGLLGALTATAGRSARHGHRPSQVLVTIAFACVATGVLFFPLMPALEHAFAFGLGAGVGALRESRRLAGRSARSGASRECAPAEAA